MSKWSSRRRFSYLLIILVILGGLLVWAYFSWFVKEDNCFDGIQNGSELGIDCGGGCQAVCSVEVQEPVVRWARTFRVNDGTYNAVASVTNPNLFGTERIQYRFRLESADGGFITERIGETYMNEDETFMIFEPNISVGKQVPKRATFKILEYGLWYRKAGNELDVPLPEFSIRDKKVYTEDGIVKAEAVVENDSLVEARDIEVVGVVFDSNNNAIASSKTFIENLRGEGNQKIVFTWPEGFNGQMAFFEVFPRVNTVRVED